MRARGASAAEVALVTLGAVAVAASFVPACLAEGEPEVLPGPWAASGRPVVVRVRGAARVRAAEGPWALPVGDSGDEFVLQTRGGAESLRTIEVVAAGSDEASPRAVPVGAVVPPLRAAFGPARAGVLVCADASLPTVREGWLAVDEIEGDPAAPSPASAAAIAAWRAGPRAATPRAAFDPLLHEPDPRVFRAMSEAAARAPALPGRVRTAGVLAALATVLLLGTTRRRPAWVRSAWVAAPGLLCGAWFAVGDVLPGRVRAVALRICGESDDLVLLRLASESGGRASFDVPAAAGHPAILAWERGDASLRDDRCGRTVEIALAPGGSRIVAWREPPAADEGVGAAPAGQEVTAWLAGLGLEPVPRDSDAGGGAAPDPDLGRRDGFVPVSVPAVRVRTRK